jgi:hypothetical protein
VFLLPRACFISLIKQMSPGSDSHKIIGILAKTSLGSETGVALHVAYLGELEIIGINTIASS